MNWKSTVLTASLVGWWVYCAGAAVSIAVSETGLAVFLAIRLVTAPRDRFAKLIRFPLFWVWAVYIATQVMAVFQGGDVGGNVERLVEDEWFSLALPVLFLNPPRVEDLRKGWMVFVGAAVVMGFYGIYQHFSGWDPLHRVVLASMGSFHRAEGTFSFYLTYGAVQLLALVVALSRAAGKDVSKRARWWCYGASVVLFLSVLATYGRSLWIGMVPVAIWWFVTLGRRWKAVVAGVAVVVVVVLSILVPELPDRVVSVGNSYINQTRTNLFRTAWRMIEAKPVLGHGIQGFPREFDQYAVDYDYETNCHPHNDSLLVWVQSGIIGLAAFWLMWVMFFRLTWRAIRRVKRNGDSNRHWQIRAGMWGVMAMLIAGFFQCYYIDAGVTAVFWVLAAVAARLSVDVTKVIAVSDQGGNGS